MSVKLPMKAKSLHGLALSTTCDLLFTKTVTHKSILRIPSNPTTLRARHRSLTMANVPTTVRLNTIFIIPDRPYKTMTLTILRTQDIVLYTAGTPNGQKVSITLEELGLKYETHKIDISKNEQKEDWFLRINRTHSLPTSLPPPSPLFHHIRPPTEMQKIIIQPMAASPPLSTEPPNQTARRKKRPSSKAPPSCCT